jgi:arginase family enzyme
MRRSQAANRPILGDAHASPYPRYHCARSREPERAGRNAPHVEAWARTSVTVTGVVAAARDALAHLNRSELDGFWIHVDADCLDDAVMPAVDFRLPGGLRPRDLDTVLTMALDTGRAVGIEITIYNAALDPDGRAGKLLADLIATALSRGQ